MFLDCLHLKSYFLKESKPVSEKAHVTVPMSDQTVRLEDSLNGLAANSAATIRMSGAIPPKEFNSAHSVEDYEPSVKWNTKLEYRYINKIDKKQNAKIKSTLNPKTLNKNNDEIETYDISNFAEPAGTIAISTKIYGKPISTYGLLQCAGISFVDKDKEIQTLLHLCPTVNKKDNDELIHYIISHSKPEDLEITIVPGCYEETDNTIAYFMDAIGEYKDKAKITFANFPDKKSNTLILQNGKLTCSDGSNLYWITNPKGKLIHAGRG